MTTEKGKAPITIAVWMALRPADQEQRGHHGAKGNPPEIDVRPGLLDLHPPQR